MRMPRNCVDFVEQEAGPVFEKVLEIFHESKDVFQLKVAKQLYVARQ